MSKNIYGLTDVTNEALVEMIRRKFLLEANTNPVLYHPIDVERCKTEDWQIERYLLEKGTSSEALSALIKAMQWKKSFGIHERNDTYFPKEWPLIYGNQKPSRDNEGRLCIWSAYNICRKISDFDGLNKQYAAFHIEKMDREAGNKGFITINDVKGAGFSNLDMSTSTFIAQISEYYPQALTYSYNLDAPWVVTIGWKIIRAFMPQNMKDKVVFIERQEILDFIDIEANEIPISFGGKREEMYDMTDRVLPLRQCKHLDFTDQQIDNFYQNYNFDKI